MWNFYMTAVSLFRLQINWRAAGHYGDRQGTGQRSVTGGAETELRRWRSKKTQRRGRILLQRGWEEGETSPGIRCFTLKSVVGPCAAQNPPQSFAYYCHVCSLCFHRRILDAWIKSFGPGETNSRGIEMRSSCVLSGWLSTGVDVSDIRNTPLNPVDTLILEECVLWFFDWQVIVVWLIWSKLPQYRSFTLNLLSLNVPAASATAPFVGVHYIR